MLGHLQMPRRDGEFHQVVIALEHCDACPTGDMICILAENVLIDYYDSGHILVSEDYTMLPFL